MSSIFKNGKKDEKRKIKIICDDCKSLFTSAKKDFGQLKRDKDGAYYNVMCPICKKIQFVDASIVDK